MWNTVVSGLNTVINRAIAGFVGAFWQHPAESALVLSVLLALAVMLWVTILTEGDEGDGFDTSGPIRLP